MKNSYLILLLVFLGLNSFAQTQDTCDYVSQENQLGGLDCYTGSMASFSADSYQWLNCDSSYIEIVGQTNEYYSGISSINVALEISYLGCVDTSYCIFTCTLGIEEVNNQDKTLMKIVDSMGRETEDKPNTLLIFIYSDGTKKKVFRIE